MSTVQLVCGLVFACMGGLIVWPGVVLFRKTYLKLVRWPVTDGVVIRIETRTDEKNARYYPIVQFKDQEGGKVIFQASVRSYSECPEIGETVTVCYNLKETDDADIRSWSLWFYPITLLIVGALVLFWSVLIFTGYLIR